MDKLDKSRRQFWAAAKKANAALVEYKKIQNDKTVPRIQITNARDASNKMADAADKVWPGVGCVVHTSACAGFCASLVRVVCCLVGCPARRCDGNSDAHAFFPPR